MTNKELGELAQSLFVQFCKQERIPQRRIPKEEGKKTADYMILLGGKEVVVEVKGINEPKELAGPERYRNGPGSPKPLAANLEQGSTRESRTLTRRSSRVRRGSERVFLSSMGTI